MGAPGEAEGLRRGGVGVGAAQCLNWLERPGQPRGQAGGLDRNGTGAAGALRRHPAKGLANIHRGRQRIADDLGSAIVDTKTNEIPVARLLFNDLDLNGRFVSLDALHTQTETGPDIVLEHGGHYLFTAKKNQPTGPPNHRETAPRPEGGFSPLGTDSRLSFHSGIKKSRLQSRSILHPPVSAEQVCFPLAAQAARSLWAVPGPQRRIRYAANQRRTRGTGRTKVAGIEPRRLCRRRKRSAPAPGRFPQLLPPPHSPPLCACSRCGLLRRISNSLFMEWRSHQPHPEYLTTTDFQSAMGEDHGRPVMRLPFSPKAPVVNRLKQLDPSQSANGSPSAFSDLSTAGGLCPVVRDPSAEHIPPGPTDSSGACRAAVLAGPASRPRWPEWCDASRDRTLIGGNRLKSGTAP